MPRFCFPGLDSGHGCPPRRLPRSGPDDPVVVEVLLVLELVDDPLGLGAIDTVDGDAPPPLRQAGLQGPDVVALAPELQIATGPPGHPPQRRVAEAVDALHCPGVADAVVVVVALDGPDDAVDADGFDQAGVAVAPDDGDVPPAGRRIVAARGLEGPAQVADPGEAVLGAGGDAGHRPVAGAVVEAGVEAGLADGGGRPGDEALPVPPRDGVAVAPGRIFADAEEGDHRADQGIRAGPGPGGAHHGAVRRNGDRIVEPPGGAGWNGVVDLRRRLAVAADEQPMDVLPEAGLHGGVVPGPMGPETRPPFLSALSSREGGSGGGPARAGPPPRHTCSLSCGGSRPVALPFPAASCCR